ncbi:sigma-70 family RNA polymerase sigma factor [Nocardia sp. NPDC101769]|uniref:sigma-70 family RNA polymerase sigma factor n=1 Tax=Nocardia sp. NPDC101769 TaxID=3364333 RepID=UPI0038008790
MADYDEFDAVRHDPDPVRRGRRAGELMTVYQQRATELARVRRAAIDEAYRERGLSYTEIAAQLGLTKGRITQIRSTAPPAERAFFGVGPVVVGIPRRYGVEEGRERPFFDAVDMTTQAAVEASLARLSLLSTAFAIEPDQAEIPLSDAVIVCGPKSAPIARELLKSDPYLDFIRTDEGWWIAEKGSGRPRFDSPFRRANPSRIDIGYFGRHLHDGRVIVHIAGITSVGSLGVARWLDTNLSDLFSSREDLSISGVVECSFDENFEITDTRLIAGPYTW